MRTQDSWGVYYWYAYLYRHGSATLETLRNRARYNNKKGRSARARMKLPISALPRSHPLRAYAEGHLVGGAVPHYDARLTFCTTCKLRHSHADSARLHSA